MIKIFTGFSDGGGSTIAHINLVNELNNLNIPAILYGPHEWHLNKCKSELLNNFDGNIKKDDIILVHFLNFKNRPNCKKFILSCHETSLFPLRQIKHDHYDIIHFVSDFQKNWHGINHPSVVIPPITYSIPWKNNSTGFAGVVGSIDSNKRTHLSIKRALDSGYKKVLLFGKITDSKYYEDHVKCFIDTGKAVYMSHIDDKIQMYNSIDKIFHSSIIECCPLVKAECLLSGIPYSELDPLPNDNPVTHDIILNKWIEVFNS